MTIGSELSNAVAFGKGQTADDRALNLEIFGGEVLTSFDLATITDDKVQVRNLKGGMKSARFPRIGLATAGYHQRGQEMLGDEIDTGEVTISPDALLTSSIALYDIDEILSHFDVRGPFTHELGAALARVYDKNNFRQIAMAARSAGAGGSFPGGTRVVDAALAADGNGKYSGLDWYDAIREANKKLFLKNVPTSEKRYMGVNVEIFDAIKYAKDANGNYLAMSQEIRGNVSSGGTSEMDEYLKVDGVTVMKTQQVPNTDETADAKVFAKYRQDFSATEAVLWTPQAVAAVKLRDITVETQRDARRQEDFVVASMFAGHGELRPECAVEFATL